MYLSFYFILEIISSWYSQPPTKQIMKSKWAYSVASADYWHMIAKKIFFWCLAKTNVCAYAGGAQF